MSLWRRKTKDRDRDALIKTALTTHFGEAIRELQRENATSEASITSSDASNNLCCVVEALFIHRLRDPFIDRVSHVLLSGDLIRQPEPNFWPFVLSLSHRHDVDFLQTCGWIRTDVGRCRAWLRLAINEGLLPSYLYTLSKDKKLVADFYEKDALFRDSEQMDIIRKLLEGLEPFQFELAVNASILNHWTTTPLMLAGLWVPPTPIIQEAVVQGVDVVESMPEDLDSTFDQASLAVNVSPPVAMLDEDLAFKLIVDSTTPSGSGRQTPLEEPEANFSRTVLTELSGTRTPLGRSDWDSGLGSTGLNVEQGSTVLVTHGLSKKASAGQPTSSLASEEKAGCFTPNYVSEFTDLPQLTSTPEDSLYVDIGFESNSKQVEQSVNYYVEPEEDFPALLQSYNSLAPTPDFFDFFKPSKIEAEEEGSSKSGDSQPGDFEVLSSGGQNRARFVTLLGTIPTEKGLVAQNYRCLDCSRPIGVLYGPAKVCGFTGGYYCDDCHTDEESVIPARIVLNGDWSKRAISRNAAVFLRETESEPLINVEKINSVIYDAFEEFWELQALRKQLNHLSAYLLTCRERVDEKFRKKLWPREHLYEHTHLYSLVDLEQIPNRILAMLIQKLVTWARSHVLACFFCSQKGFICEFCRHEEPIFPFDVSLTFRCELCGAVFHAQCMTSIQPCPKCERRKVLQSKYVESGEEH